MIIIRVKKSDHKKLNIKKKIIQKPKFFLVGSLRLIIKSSTVTLLTKLRQKLVWLKKQYYYFRAQ